MRNMDALAQAVDREWVAESAMELVSIPSVTMDEAEVCRCFEDQLRQLGLLVEVRPVTEGRNNLYARLPGSGEGPALMFNGHLDTIPTGLCPPCRRDGDRLYGRGSTDMKGGLAAALGAIRALKANDVQLAGDVLITAVVGHEEIEAQKDGPKALITDVNNGCIDCDRILIVEGRDALWVMSMGSMVFTITLTSNRGGQHTQYVPFADNPIRHMGDIICRINRCQAELNGGDLHPLAGAERIDLGIARSGDYFNRTPPSCTLTGTRRWVPGRTAEEVLTELEAMVIPSAEAGNLQWLVEMEHQREPFETAPDDAAVMATASAHRRVTGQEPEYLGLRIVGDANLYVHGCGVPTFYYGPSNETAHADQEWVSVERMAQAAQVYALTTVTYCGLARR